MKSITSLGVTALLCALLPLAPAFSQNLNLPVLAEQKISETQGGLQSTLNNGDRLGRATAIIGDVNNDGIADMAVGAYAPANGSAGSVWIFMLNASGQVIQEVQIGNNQGGFTGDLDAGDQFGVAVCPLGDLNGDGVPDIAVGANEDDDGGNDHGAVWILFLNANGTVNSHQKISDTHGNFTGTFNGNVLFGVALDSIGDINNDGNTDLAVGAMFDNDGGSLHGATWVLRLNSNGTVQGHQKISDTQGSFTATLDINDRFGGGVCGIGDLNGDGNPDLAVTAGHDDDGGTDRGAVYILFLNSNGTVASYQKISDTQGNFTGTLDNTDLWGGTPAYLGDLNGDGRIEVAVGAANDDDGGFNRGAIWLLSLNTNGTVYDYIKISSTSGNLVGPLNDDIRFGIAGGGGDIDGDGFYELTTGAFLDNDGGPQRGSAWVLFFGECNLDASFSASDTITCVNDSVQLTAHDTTAAVYNWYYNGAHYSSQMHPMLGFLEQGPVQMTLIMSDSNCADTAVLWLTVHPAPYASAGPDQFICAGDQAFLGSTPTGPAGSTFQWSPALALNDPADANPIATPTTNTQWHLLVTDSNGCTASDSVLVTVNPTPPADAGPDQSLCEGESIQIGGAPTTTSGNTVTWSPATALHGPNLPNPNAEPTTTTTYVVQVTDANGCFNTDSVTVTVYPTPVITLGPHQFVQVGQSITLNPGTFASYQWSTGATTPTLVIQGTTVGQTSYAVTVTDVNGCTAIDSVGVSVVVSVSEIEKSLDVKIYPNPANDQVVIEAAEPFTVDLYDVTGKLIERHREPGSRTVITVNHLASGFYVLALDADGVQVRKKILVDR